MGSLRRILAVAAALALHALAPAADDCNRNGIDDAQDLAGGASRDCNRNGVPDECDLAPTHLAFEPARRLRVVETPQQFPEGVVPGDFNGDALPDLVVELEGFGGGSRIVILLNAGNGDFADPKDITALFTVNGLAAADLNGDGKLDLVAGEIMNGSMVHFLLGNGDGAFGPRRTTRFAGNAGHIVAAELDGDGDIDLLVSTETSPGITLFRNGGRGSFLISALQPASADFTEMYLLGGDLDGDRDFDFLVPPRQPGTGVVLFRNRGDASFDEETLRDDFTFQRPPFVGDFDGDRDPDLLAGGGDLFPNLGDATFDSPRPSDLPVNQWFSSYCGTAGDIDGDGDLDLMLGSSCVDAFRGRKAILIFRNRGDGTFSPAETVPLLGFAQPVLVAELNGDAVPDIVALGSGSVLVFLGAGATAPASADVNQNQLPDECEPDCDRDGLPDAHAVRTGKARDCNQNGVPDACDVQAAVRFEKGECIVPAGFSGSFVVADFDKNGELDLAFLRALGTDANPSPTVFETDQRLEVYLNVGGGVFVAGQELEFDAPPMSLAVGDFDQDGIPDLFGPQLFRGSVLILSNDGSGAFTVVDEFPALQFPLEANALDLNGDGLDDLLVECGVNDAYTAAVLLNEGGAFSRPRTFNTRGRVVALADLDGGGSPDILTDDTTGSVSVTWNDGGTVFQRFLKRSGEAALGRRPGSGR